MAKYWGKQIFTEVGQKQKTERGERKKKDDRKLVITMASYALHTSGGARKAAWANFVNQMMDQM